MCEVTLSSKAAERSENPNILEGSKFILFYQEKNYELNAHKPQLAKDAQNYYIKGNKPH
jgi:hypothetical protein